MFQIMALQPSFNPCVFWWKTLQWRQNWCWGSRYGYHFHAGTTGPAPHRLSIHVVFGTEGVSVHGLLAYFNFLHCFPEEGTKQVPCLPTIVTLVQVGLPPQMKSRPRGACLGFLFTWNWVLYVAWSRNLVETFFSCRHCISFPLLL